VVRNGKHSFEGDSCSLVIDVSKIKALEYSKEKREVILGASLTLGTL
jgi:hypothetical protein